MDPSKIQNYIDTPWDKSIIECANEREAANPLGITYESLAPLPSRALASPNCASLEYIDCHFAAGFASTPFLDISA